MHSDPAFEASGNLNGGKVGIALCPSALFTGASGDPALWTKL